MIVQFEHTKRHLQCLEVFCFGILVVSQCQLVLRIPITIDILNWFHNISIDQQFIIVWSNQRNEKRQKHILLRKNFIPSCSALRVKNATTIFKMGVWNYDISFKMVFHCLFNNVIPFKCNAKIHTKLRRNSLQNIKNPIHNIVWFQTM